MDLGLTDRAFVVTAASTGLGRATAQQLVAEGARVVLVARRAELLAEAVSRLGPDRAVALAADLTDANTADTACALALDAFGRLDGALISVGGPPAGTVLGTSEQQWRGAFESVFLATLRVSSAVLRNSTSQDVCIAWVLSTSVKMPIPGLAASIDPPLDMPKRASRTPLSVLNSCSASGNGMAFPELAEGSLL